MTAPLAVIHPERRVATAFGSYAPPLSPEIQLLIADFRSLARKLDRLDHMATHRSRDEARDAIPQMRAILAMLEGRL